MIPKAFTQILSHEEPGCPSSSSVMYMNVNLEISGGTFGFYEGEFEEDSSISHLDLAVRSPTDLLFLILTQVEEIS